MAKTTNDQLLRGMRAAGLGADDLSRLAASMPENLSIVNSDGSLNYTAINAAINDPQYEGWRQSNPVALQQLKANSSAESANRNINAAQDAGRTIFGLSQIAEAKRTGENPPPMYAPLPDRSTELSSSLQQARILAEAGMSAQERSRRTSDADRVFRSQLGQASAGSAGGAGNFQANAQRAAQMRYDQGRQISGDAEQNRMAMQGRVNALLRMQQSETDMRRRHMHNQYLYQRRPDFVARQQAAERLRSAGIQNVDAALDAMGGNLRGLNDMFRGDTPGIVRANDFYRNQTITDPLQKVLASPAFTMATSLPGMGIGAPISATAGMIPNQNLAIPPAGSVPPGQPQLNPAQTFGGLGPNMNYFQ